MYEDMTRTGTMNDSSAFFHAIMTSLFNSYRNVLDRAEKTVHVKQLRKKFGESITFLNWKQTRHYLPWILSRLKTSFLNVMSVFYEHINDPRACTSQPVILVYTKLGLINGNTKEAREIHQLIVEIAPYNAMAEIVQEELHVSHGNTSLEDHYETTSEALRVFFAMLLEKFGDLESSRVAYFVRKFSSIISSVWEQCLIDLFNRDMRTIKNPKKSINFEDGMGHLILGYLSEFFEVNIYVLDTHRLLLPSKAYSGYQSSRNSVVITRVGNTHYESIGVRVEENTKRHTRRCLKPTHDLSKACNLLSKNIIEAVRVLPPKLLAHAMVGKMIPVKYCEEAWHRLNAVCKVFVKTNLPQSLRDENPELVELLEVPPEKVLEINSSEGDSEGESDAEPTEENDNSSDGEAEETE
jgi:hypothetical protein